MGLAGLLGAFLSFSLKLGALAEDVTPLLCPPKSMAGVSRAPPPTLRGALPKLKLVERTGRRDFNCSGGRPPERLSARIWLASWRVVDEVVGDCSPGEF